MEQVTPLEHVTANAQVLLLLVLADWVIFTPIAKRRCKKVRDVYPARWFFVHSFANLLVVIMSMKSIWAVLKDPLHAMDIETYPDRSFRSPATRWPLTIINSVHIYHMIGGFRLSGDDYFHHLVFIPTLGFPGQYFNWGPLGPWLGFFISGLPGGIDYFMLALVKIGALHRLTEKKISANLNAWCRCPGIMVTTVLFCQAVLYGYYNRDLPTIFIILYIVLPPYNGIYYGRQAVSNYTVNFIKDNILDVVMKPKYRQSSSSSGKRGNNGAANEPLNIHMRTSKMTGLEVVDWKAIIADLGKEPQRAS